MLKAVIDANVWISALISPGNPRLIVTAFKNNVFNAYYPRELLIELSDVLSRPKFKGTIKPENVAELVALIKSKATVTVSESLPTGSRDPKDNLYLACAETAVCDYLVTGDRRHLLVLKQYGQTKIVTPAEFVAVLNAL